MPNYKIYKNFTDFWPYYLSEHQNALCRVCHFLGTTGALLILLATLYTQKPLYLLGMPLCGYGAAWVGHFLIEKNRPATFTYPLWSLLGDLIMWTYMLRGRLWRESTVDFLAKKREKNR